MIDSRMKIRHLQCFMEVARLGHVGRAADQLAVTQPAVSKTLRELEELLNVRLFTRGPKGLALTPLGEAFQHHAATGVVALQQAIDVRGPGQAAGRHQHLRIGALPTVAVRLMPQAVRELTAQRRDAAVHLITGPNAHPAGATEEPRARCRGGPAGRPRPDDRAGLRAALSGADGRRRAARSSAARASGRSTCGASRPSRC